MLFKRRARQISRLLVVEDEPLVAFDNEHVLTSDGYDILATVDTAEEALPLIEADGLDALVTDVRLAGTLNGADLGRAARAKGLAVLLVTGSCPDDASAFADACLLKPYRPQDLIDALRAIETMRATGKVKRASPRLTLFPHDPGTPA